MGRHLVALPAALLVLSTSFVAQQPSSGRRLQFAQLTYGTSIDAMTPDNAGGAWLAGRTCSSDLPTTPGALQPGPGGDCDAFLGRIDAGGAIVYLSYFGPGFVQIRALTLDAAGNLYLAGSTASPDFPTTADAYDRTCGADGTCMAWKMMMRRQWFMATSDGFVTKLTPDGDRILYSTFIGATQDDYVNAIAIDEAGRIHVAGGTTSSDFPVTAGALQPSYVGGSNPDGDALDDAFYARLSTGGSTLEYSTYLGGYGSEWPGGIAVDATGDAYVGGTTDSREFPLLNAWRTRIDDGTTMYVPADGWLARFGGSGAVYSTYVGGSDGDDVSAVGVEGTTVYLAGSTCSNDFPGTTAVECRSAFISELSATTGTVTRTVLLHGAGGVDRIERMFVDANRVAYVTGTTWYTNTFPTTPDAAQRTSGGQGDAFVAIVPMGPQASGTPLYSSYLGGANDEQAWALAPDGNGGVYFAGYSRLLQGQAGFPSQTTQAQPPPEPTSSGSPGEYQSFIAYVSVVDMPPPVATPDIVLYARNASVAGSSWQFAADSSAAGGTRIWNPDAGVPKIGTASAAPASFFELTFQAEGGVPYHLWLRMKADNDHWTNDSVFVQFSDSVDSSGNPIWRTGATSATMVSLEDCSGCGEHGWGWNDNGYNAPAPPVTFATTGTHTIRIQQREDGISIDQVVLSRQTYVTSAPGSPKDDTTILAQSDGGPSEPPPPPSDPREIVMHVAGERLAGGQNWIVTSDTTAAGGARLLNPDAGQAKLSSPSASGSDYFEVQFTAEAGVPYHLWIRSQATNDHWTNDSVFVQFSDSVDAGGNPIWRIGGDSATWVSLEDCSGCGEQGWGWNDNAYGGFAAPIYFAKSGPQTIRVLRREDGISIDQIVLSAGTYLNASPGLAKNDTTIVPK